MVTKAEFYRELTERLIRRSEFLMGKKFTQRMLKETLGDYVKENEKVWKKDGLPSPLQKVVD